MKSFADVIAESFVCTNQNLATSQYQPHQPPHVLGVAGITLPLGLDALHNP